jgi:hypothetical protein
MHIRHGNWLVWVNDGTTSDKLFMNDSEFKVSPKEVVGLKGIQIEAINYPKHFMRSQSGRIKLSKSDDKEPFNKESTWVPVKVECS